MSYNKVFFHSTGRGIGDMMTTLDAAKIPFTIKSIKDEGFVIDALKLRRANGVKHNIIYRDTDPGGWGNDHPNLDLPPDEAAIAHWDVVEAALPVAVRENRSFVWVEPVNEIDTHAHAEWLGGFCYFISLYAMSRGYKILLAGFNAGQPDIGMWERYFSEFLEVCSISPEWVGVSLHEAKFGDMSVPAWDDEYYPWTIGRFEFLMEACDNLGYAHPTTFVSEWAWAYNDVPGNDVMMRDVAWYSGLLAKYPSVLGACLWNLDPGGGSAADKLPHLIPHITDYTLNVIHPDPVPPPAKSVEQIIWDHSIETQCISLNPDAALQGAILKDGYTPVGTEAWLNVYGDDWAYMAAETLDGKSRRVYTAPVPAWDLVSYITNPYLPEPEPDPPRETYNMLKYFWPLDNANFGPVTILVNNWHGGSERQQLQRAGPGPDSYLTKNSAWEKRIWNGFHIWLVMDTSPGGGQYYTAHGEGWMPVSWAVGDTHRSLVTIKFFRKDDCGLVNQYDSVSKLHFAKHYDTWITPKGLEFQDVVEIEWYANNRVDETYWYAAGVGLVRWLKYDGRESVAVEYIPQGTQKDNEREVIHCT